MDVRYPTSSKIPCPLCNQKVYLFYVTKLNSYRKILPKLVLPTIEEEPEDPQPSVLLTKEELDGIQNHVQEALVWARKRHTAGTMLAEPEHVSTFQINPL